jgi:hypothetical protein
LPYAIKAGQRTEKEINSHFNPDGSKYLPEPESLAYEKTLFPFIILSKKRYVGNLYEDDPNKKPKQKSMGIVLKRRDNAPIVKQMYGGVIDILLNHYDLNASVEFLKGRLQDLVDGKVPLEDLIITKTLRADYKDPTKIAHKVLADRMGDRDEGNKPAANDRIPYVYIHAPHAKLQGDRIEHPEYIREMKLVPDYSFYITNQLMKPICQLYSLCIEKLSEYPHPITYWTDMDKELSEKPMYNNPKKRKNRMDDLRIRCASEILFDPYLEQLGVAPKKRAGTTSAKAKAESKAKRLANITLRPVTHTLVLETTDAKSKGFIGRLTYSTCDSNNTLWEKTITYKANEAKNKTLCQVKIMEQAFQELYDKGVLPKEGAVCIKINARFGNKWLKALHEAEELADLIKKAIDSNDYGAVEENMDLQLFMRLVGAADKCPYVIEPMKISKTKNSED